MELVSFKHKQTKQKAVCFLSCAYPALTVCLVTTCRRSCSLENQLKIIRFYRVPTPPAWKYTNHHIHTKTIYMVYFHHLKLHYPPFYVPLSKSRYKSDVSKMPISPIRYNFFSWKYTKSKFFSPSYNNRTSIIFALSENAPTNIFFPILQKPQVISFHYLKTH